MCIDSFLRWLLIIGLLLVSPSSISNELTRMNSPRSILNPSSNTHKAYNFHRDQGNSSASSADIKQILIVDTTVPKLEILLNGLDSSIRVVQLNAKTDGVSQISEAVKGYRGLAAIHIVSHGGSGSLSLGSSTITSNKLDKYRRQLALIGNALSKNGELLLYGCNVATGRAGVHFINQLAGLTHAKVAASNDMTGSSNLGGDWQLEIATGQITTTLPFNLATLMNYPEVLPNNSAPTFQIGDGKVTTDIGSATSDYIEYLALQSDGKILAAGTSSDECTLARYNKDGSLDTSFGGSGKVHTRTDYRSCYAHSLAVQADGKILLAGTSISSDGLSGDFALMRYNKDGSLDSSFDVDGKVTHSFPNSDTSDYGRSVAIQSDGKIIMGGYNIWHKGKIGGNYASVTELIRFNSNGSVDNDFGGLDNGDLYIRFINSSNYGRTYSIKVQTDDKILVGGYDYDDAGTTSYDFALARLNKNGSYDTVYGNPTMGFGFNGKVITNLLTTGGNSFNADQAYSIAIQTDGKIVQVGVTEYNNWLSLVRYNSDGSLDTSFDGDGKVSTYLQGSGESVAIQTDGKIVVAVSTTDHIFTLVRYNKIGSLDVTFDGDGIVKTNFGYPTAFADSVAVQPDGKIVVGGSTNGDFALARYNTNGSLDITFDAVNTLNGTANYNNRNIAVALDSSVQIYDAELAAQGNYNGASIKLYRHGGAASQDVFSGSGNLNITNDNAALSGIVIGQVVNGNGAMTLTFNSNATQERVNTALSSLAYSNSSTNPPASVQIDWIFSDGNNGSQGTGGALTATGSTTVVIAGGSAYPTVRTGLATSVSTSIATLNGIVNPNGLATTAQFEYGLTTNYGTNASVTLSPNNGMADQDVSKEINGLEPDKTYHYRLTATNSQGNANGVDATFSSKPITFPLTIKKLGSGLGKVTANDPSVTCSDYCTFDITATTLLTLTATAQSGYTFSGWSGDCTGTAMTCGLYMVASKSVTATFKINQTISFETPPTLIVGGSGKVMASGGKSGNPVVFSSLTQGVCSTGGSNGSTVTGVTAGICTIAANQTGNDNYSPAPQGTQSFNVNSGLALTITNFNKPYGTVTSNTGGIACGATCASTIGSGSTVTLVAIPVAGYQFSGWGGDCSGYGNSCVVTMNAAKSITAKFEIFKKRRSIWKRMLLMP